jgi:hypothetical protein
MRVSDQVNLDLIRNILNAVQQVRQDVTDTLPQAFECFGFSRQTGNVAFVDIPDLGFVIPERADESVTAHQTILLVKPATGSMPDAPVAANT